MGKLKVNIFYVTPTGKAVPCHIGPKLITPLAPGGYAFLKRMGFETIYQYRKRKKDGKSG